jgi:hypothetical protein
VEKSSAGRFGADPQAIYERWHEFREWAATASTDDARRSAWTNSVLRRRGQHRSSPSARTTVATLTRAAWPHPSGRWSLATSRPSRLAWTRSRNSIGNCSASNGLTRSVISSFSCVAEPTITPRTSWQARNSKACTTSPTSAAIPATSSPWWITWPRTAIGWTGGRPARPGPQPVHVSQGPRRQRDRVVYADRPDDRRVERLLGTAAVARDLPLYPKTWEIDALNANLWGPFDPSLLAR